MTITIGKKQIAVAAVIAAVLIGVLIYTTSVGSAFTLDKATDLAKKYVPSSAELKNTEDEITKYEINFYDSKAEESFEVEVRKDAESVSKVESKLDDDRGSSKVVLTKTDVEKIMKERLEDIVSITVQQTKDDGLYVYEVSFKADDFYGSAEVNPETGAVLEQTVKYGTMTAIPGTKPGADGKYITAEEAVSLVEKELGQGTIITDYDLEKEDGVYVYEIEAVKDSTEYNYLVDAISGKLTLESQHDRYLDSDDETVFIPENSSSSGTGSSSGSSSSSQNSSLITYAKAQQIVLNKVPGANIYEINLEFDDGRYVYEGEARKGNYKYEFEIHAKTGSVLSWESDYEGADYDDDDYDRPSGSTGSSGNTGNTGSSSSSVISMQKAKNIVLAKIPGARITEIELDRDDGIYIYEGQAIKGEYEYEFEINAKTGALISWEKESIYD